MSSEEIAKIMEDYLRRYVSFTGERYDEIKEEYRVIAKRVRDGSMSQEEADRTKEALTKESEEAEIIFLDPEDYAASGAYLASRLNVPFFIETVAHEIEHTIPYREVGILSLFGWHKFKNVGLQTPMAGFHKPHGEKYVQLSDDQRAKLKYKSLKAVSKPSSGDLQDIKRLEEIYGLDFFAQ